MKPDIKPADRGEQVTLMEPTTLGDGYRYRRRLMDIALELAQKSAGFRRSLPGSLVASFANLVRSMNCYYSNLIEGHDTHPVDIERALRNDYSQDVRKRDLQLEAKAHIYGLNILPTRPDSFRKNGIEYTYCFAKARAS